MRSSNLSNEYAELFGQRPTVLAKREATLYKHKVQNLQMRAQCIREKIICTVQGITMSCEACGFLMLLKSLPESLRIEFYDQEIDGISLKPTFVNEFTKKELKFLDELQRSIETEMHEAIQQIKNEDCQNIHVETLKAFTESQRLMEEFGNTIRQKFTRFGEKLTAFETLLEDMETRHRNMISTAHKCEQTPMPDKSTAVRLDDQMKPPEGEVVGDLLHTDGEEEQSQTDVPVHQGDEPSEQLNDKETWTTAGGKDNDQMQRPRS
ncbi:hypothetical protein RB195_023888 [Necator americanus]|uniref:Uncharacterized protein n=2 Tax=Necator americanus TaxID=51031 RepID=A0ABR1EL02_NECAM